MGNITENKQTVWLTIGIREWAINAILNFNFLPKNLT